MRKFTLWLETFASVSSQSLTGMALSWASPLGLAWRQCGEDECQANQGQKFHSTVSLQIALGFHRSPDHRGMLCLHWFTVLANIKRSTIYAVCCNEANDGWMRVMFAVKTFLYKHWITLLWNEDGVMNDSLLAAHTALSVGSFRGKGGLVFDIISGLPAPSMLMSNAHCGLYWSVICLFTRLCTKSPGLLEVLLFTNTKMLLWGCLKTSLWLGCDVFSVDWSFYLFVGLFFFRVNALQQ